MTPERKKELTALGIFVVLLCGSFAGIDVLQERRDRIVAEQQYLASDEYFEKQVASLTNECGAYFSNGVTTAEMTRLSDSISTTAEGVSLARLSQPIRVCVKNVLRWRSYSANYQSDMT